MSKQEVIIKIIKDSIEGSNSWKFVYKDKSDQDFDYVMVPLYENLNDATKYLDVYNVIEASKENTPNTPVIYVYILENIKEEKLYGVCASDKELEYSPDRINK